MMKRWKRPAALLVAAMLAGCSNAAGAAEGSAVDLDFPIDRTQGEAPFAVREGVGQLVIRGYFRAPCTPYDARAEADVAAATITVRLIGEQPGSCWDAIVNLGYQATVRALPAGSYRLHVIHTLPETRWPTETVVDTQVVVR